MKGIKRLYPIISSIVMAVAFFGGVHVASWFGLHQPKAPKCLK